MNILYITNHLNIGGITSYLLNLATGIKQRGHNVLIASSGGELLSNFTDRGITFIPISIRTKKEVSPKILLSALKLSKFIKNNAIDIAHSNSRTTQVLGSLLNEFKGIPHVSTCHGFFKKRFFRKIFPCWGKKVIAISESVKEHLIRDFKVNKDNIVVIYNGIDVDKFRVPCLSGRQGSSEFRVQTKKSLGLGEGLVVGIVARLSDVKGHIYLIEAMKIVLESEPRAQLLIVGDGPMKEGLVRQVRRLGIEERVFFMPGVTDTKYVLPAMDLFVMPSLKEGLGLALMEAMAAGLTVIGSDVGGIKSLIQDEYNGLLVRPKDTKQLAEGILELLRDEEKRKYLGRNAQDFIGQKFSLRDMARRTEEVYLSCLDAKD